MDLDKIKESKSTENLLKFSIINIDKPTGPTSFSVSHYLMKELKLNKTSHAGTLDPQVTGVLPIMLGRACKLSDYFMHKNKTYVGIMRIHEEIDEKELKQVIEEFIGKIMQLPPKKSRVKREIREREIVSFNILEKDGKDILFETEVQAGTYIRKLIHDIGEKIGGAHMLELRRTKAGIFDESKIYNLYEFDSALQEYKEGNDKALRDMLVPAEIVSTLLPVIQLKKESNLKQVLTGKPLMEIDINEKGIQKIEKFCLFLEERFLGIYKSVKEGDIIARAEFVCN
ncbi:MAG: RNA-guided pseudouridylation complex pseudouridine synthase subunit Cbf5 [Nanoarchaeota archaeon]